MKRSSSSVKINSCASIYVGHFRIYFSRPPWRRSESTTYIDKTKEEEEKEKVRETILRNLIICHLYPLLDNGCWVMKEKNEASSFKKKAEDGVSHYVIMNIMNWRIRNAA